MLSWQAGAQPLEELLEEELLELPPLDELDDEELPPEDELDEELEDEELLEDDVVVDVPLRMHVLARSVSLTFAMFSPLEITGNVEQSLAI